MREASIKTKSRLQEFLVCSFLLCGCKTGAIKVSKMLGLNLFDHRCIGRILGRNLRNRVPNEIIRQCLEQKRDLKKIVCHHCLSWFGHACCRPDNSFVFRHVSTNHSLLGKKAWRPVKTLEETIKSDLETFCGLRRHDCQ